jgi:hypothetical protein
MRQVQLLGPPASPIDPEATQAPAGLVRDYQHQLNRYAALVGFVPVRASGVADRYTWAATVALGSYFTVASSPDEAGPGAFYAQIWQSTAALTAAITPAVVEDLRVTANKLELPQSAPRALHVSPITVGLVGLGTIGVGFVAGRAMNARRKRR